MYEGVPFFYQANEDFYLARIHEAKEGHVTVASPFLLEYKNNWPLVLPFGEYFYIALSGLTGLTVTQSIVLSKFLFPAILFYLIYYLLRLLLIDRRADIALWAGLAGSSAVVLGIGLADYTDVIGRFLHGTTYPALSIWTRPVNPITGALLLFTLLIALVRMREWSRWSALGIGLMLVAMSGYIFSFGVGIAVMVILAALSLLVHEYEYTKKLVIAVGTPLLLIGSYALLVVTPAGESTLAKNGLLLSHAPFVNKILCAAAVLVCALMWFAYRRGIVGPKSIHNISLRFSLSFLVAGMAALNQHVVTGITIWPHHLVQYTTPLSILSVILVATLALEASYPRLLKVFFASIIAASTVFSMWNIPTYTTVLEDFRAMQNFTPVFQWIREHAPHTCVVMTAENERMRFTNLVPGFTQCDVYGLTHSSAYAPSERIEHNYFTLLRLRGVSEQEADQYFATHVDELVTRYHKDWVELFDPGDQPRIKSLIPEITLRYRKFLEQDFRDEVQKFRVDYLVDMGDLDTTATSELGVKKAFEHAGITVYSF